MAIAELPEPLHTAVKGVARMLTAGVAGTSSMGGTPQPYRRMVSQSREAVLAALRAEVEMTAPGLTLRIADVSLYRMRPHRSVLLLLVVCAASRPEAPVTIMSSVDQLYTLTAPNGASDGLVVAKASPRLSVQR